MFRIASNLQISKGTTHPEIVLYGIIYSSYKANLLQWKSQRLFQISSGIALLFTFSERAKKKSIYVRRKKEIRVVAFLSFCSTEFTMVENHRKSLIQHCERSELPLHFEWPKVQYKCQKWSIWWVLWKPEACGQTVLPDRSILIGQFLKMPKFKN